VASFLLLLTFNISYVIFTKINHNAHFLMVYEEGVGGTSALPVFSPSTKLAARTWAAHLGKSGKEFWQAEARRSVSG